jgi:threonine dehydrogenase-like Zn-dependent dehydrogenase
MKALCWKAVNRLSTESVPDPVLQNEHDAIVRVLLSSVCGSDLHLLDGQVTTMEQGDVIGHEFIGEVVETGPAVKTVIKGDRVVVSPVIGCGRCYFCGQGLWSLCDNSNPHPDVLDKEYGYATAGILGHSHAFGGFAGSHAEYVRVPFADRGAFKVPEKLSNEQALFASDALPTGYMGAELCNLHAGDIVAVWGCGGVGQMAIRSAYLLGAERVIAIDRVAERLGLAEEFGHAETLNYEEVDVSEALREMTGGRGPDSCIDAVGMEAHDLGLQYVYDRVKQAVRLETDRPTVLRQAIHACRKGGNISVMGVYGGYVDKFPLGALMNKGLTLRAGQQHGPRYIPELLGRIERGELDPSYLATHRMSLDDGARGYEMFKKKENGCLRVVFAPAS